LGVQGLIIKDEDLNGDINDEESLEKAINEEIVELEIEVEAAKFEEAVQKSYLKNSKKFTVPGFRKGKAPRSIIERYYGKEVFYEDAINIVCADAYDKAIEENDIFPVDRPTISIKKIGEGENLVFTASVTSSPKWNWESTRASRLKRLKSMSQMRMSKRSLRQLRKRTPESCLWKTGAYKKAI